MDMDGVPLCFTMEDCDRGLTSEMTEGQIKAAKVHGKTAIPSGVYNLTLTPSLRFNRTLPLITPVKGFDGIRIHAGNTPNDTEGCILLGRSIALDGGVCSLLRSRLAVEGFIQRIDWNQTITLNITYHGNIS